MIKLRFEPGDRDDEYINTKIIAKVWDANGHTFLQFVGNDRILQLHISCGNAGAIAGRINILNRRED